MEQEPKRWKCENGHLMKIPKRERVVLSNFDTFYVYCCRKCHTSKIKETDEWINWLNANRDRQLEQIKANGGKLMGVQIFPKGD